LANFALAELGTWDWIADHLAQGNEEQKRKILMYLPGAIGLLAGAMALVGSVHGIATGALNFAEKALFVAQSFLAIFDGVTTFGKGIADARRIWTQADLSEIQARLVVNQEDFNITLEDVKSSMNDFGDVHKKTKKTIEAIIQSNTQLVRQG
jgi:arginine/ornithine N-succinyltransferase beta subunit